MKNFVVSIASNREDKSVLMGVPLRRQHTQLAESDGSTHATACRFVMRSIEPVATVQRLEQLVIELPSDLLHPYRLTVSAAIGLPANCH